MITLGSMFATWVFGNQVRPIRVEYEVVKDPQTIRTHNEEPEATHRVALSPHNIGGLKPNPFVLPSIRNPSPPHQSSCHNRRQTYNSPRTPSRAHSPPRRIPYFHEEAQSDPLLFRSPSSCSLH